MTTHLPGELNYLREPARCYGPAWRFWSQPRRVEAHGQAWRELATAHRQIHQREDGPAIAVWLAAPLDTALGLDEQRQLRGLLRLLRALGRASLTPFDAPKLSIILVKEPAGPATTKDNRLTGSHFLPIRLRYLPRQAKQLGIRPRWNCLADFVDEIDEPRFNALCLTAHRMRQRGDDLLLRRWLSQRTGSMTREAALARCLLHILDALEIF